MGALVVAVAAGAVDPLVAQGVFYDLGDSDPPTVLTESIGDRRVAFAFPGSGPATPLGAVVFVMGVPDDASSLGPLMDGDYYQDWARVVAAEGHVGVLSSTSDPVADLHELMELIASEGPRLRIDLDRVALSRTMPIPLTFQSLRFAQGVTRLPHSKRRSIDSRSTLCQRTSPFDF